MARGTPSMVALLGLLAIAGYQNREKIAQILGSLGGKGDTGAGGGSQDTSQEALKHIREMAGTASAGGLLSDGLGGLLDQFKQNGQGKIAESWVSTGPNQTATSQQLEQAIGSDVIATLSERTGLTREELLSRLTRELPQAVDRLTPRGKIPTAEEADQMT